MLLFLTIFIYILPMKALFAHKVQSKKHILASAKKRFLAYGQTFLKIQAISPIHGCSSMLRQSPRIRLAFSLFLKKFTFFCTFSFFPTNHLALAHRQISSRSIFDNLSGQIHVFTRCLSCLSVYIFVSGKLFIFTQKPRFLTF